MLFASYLQAWKILVIPGFRISGSWFCHSDVPAFRVSGILAFTTTRLPSDFCEKQNPWWIVLIPIPSPRQNPLLISLYHRTFSKKSVFLRVKVKGKVAHQAGSYPRFCSMKRLEEYFYSPGWVIKCAGTCLYTWVERQALGGKVPCPLEHNKMRA